MTLAWTPLPLELKGVFASKKSHVIKITTREPVRSYDYQP